jgi:hypothetical protein
MFLRERVFDRLLWRGRPYDVLGGIFVAMNTLSLSPRSASVLPISRSLCPLP